MEWEKKMINFLIITMCGGNLQAELRERERESVWSFSPSLNDFDNDTLLHR